MSGIGDAFRPFGKEYDTHTPASEIMEKSDVATWRMIETLRKDLAAAQAVLREVECHAHECPRCYGPETWDGAGNRWYVAHKPGCALSACLKGTT